MKTYLNHIKALREIGLILFLTCLMIGIVYGQAPAIEWQNSLGGSMDETATSIKQTSDGGYIVAGVSNSNDGNVNGNNGDWDSWIIKLTAVGALDWQHPLGGGGREAAFGIIETLDGGFMAGGYSTENGGDVTGNHGSRDYWITKLSSSGALEWQKSYGGSFLETCQSILQTSDGGYILVGDSSSIDGDVTGNHGDFDIWVVKINSIGIIQWQKSYGGSDTEAGNQIINTTDGNFLIAGYSRSLNGDVSVNLGGYDFWLIKIDPNGALLWEKSYGGSDNEYAFDVHTTNDGGYIVGGFTFSNDGDVTGNNGLNDCWLIKLDGNGNLQWQRALGGSDGDGITGIDVTPNGKYVIFGGSSSNNGDVSGNHGLADYWAALIDTDGAILWQRSLGGSENDNGYKIDITNDGGYCLAGSSASNDGDVSGNHGQLDFWVVKLAPDPLLVAEFEPNMVRLYPNPVAAVLQIEGEETIDKVAVFNLLGLKLLEQLPNSDKTTIDMEGYSEGTYLLHITSKKRTTPYKLIKN
jgi:hypothetical protein